MIVAGRLESDGERLFLITPQRDRAGQIATFVEKEKPSRLARLEARDGES